MGACQTGGSWGEIEGDFNGSTASKRNQEDAYRDQLITRKTISNFNYIACNAYFSYGRIYHIDYKGRKQMSLLEPVRVVYRGGWADEHTLPLREFAKSADGFDDILSLCAEFAITQQVILNRSARSVRLVTKAPASGSFEFNPMIEAALQHPLIVSASSGLFGAVTVLVFAKLAKRLEEAVLKSTVEKLLEELGREKERNSQVVERFILNQYPSSHTKCIIFGRVSELGEDLVD